MVDDRVTDYVRMEVREEGRVVVVVGSAWQDLGVGDSSLEQRCRFYGSKSEELCMERRLVTSGLVDESRQQ